MARGAQPHASNGGVVPKRDGASVFDRSRHVFAVLTALATLALIFVGGLVTTLEAGLSVPDWPLSYGTLTPPMVGNVFYEHGHRMVASFVGLLTLILAVWTSLRESRRGVKTLAWVALATVVLQGGLGGLTVLLLLPPAVSVAHACLAQTFFCIMVSLAYATSRDWLEAEQREDATGLRAAAALATGLTFLQLLLGAVMRHLGAGLAIQDFPLAQGRLIPTFDSVPVAVHFAHRFLALGVFASVVWLSVLCRRSEAVRFKRLGALATVLVITQITLGALTVLTGKAVLPTTAHVATGAALLGTAWLLTLRAFRYLRAPAGLVARTQGLPTTAGVS